MLNKNNIIKENMAFEIATNGEKRLIVIDINVLPLELKDKNIEDTTKEYRELYPNYDFLFINTSRQNMEGNIATNPPVYVI